MPFIKNKIYYEFDRIRLQVVAIKCLGVNADTDNWVRFRYIRYNDTGFELPPNKTLDEFTSYPQSSHNSGFFDTKHSCVLWVIREISTRCF